MDRFIVKDLPLDGLKLITSKRFEDNRGFFSKIFCHEELSFFNNQKPINQINLSFTKNEGSIRGLHYQTKPYGETKIINCLRGKIFDVAVDLRPKSDTFLEYFSIELSENSNDSLLIPEGFAHGFQTLTKSVEMIYFHSMPYNENYEAGINAFDKNININWPKRTADMSERDKNLPFIDHVFEGVNL